MAADDTAQVIAEVNRLRSDLGPRDTFRKPEFLEELVGRLTASPVLAGQAVVQAFAEDARGFAEQPRLTRTKRMINAGTDATIFGLFDASYFPSLSLDYLRYRTLPTDARLASRYASPTMPVVIEQMSAGFESRVVVALFPENYVDGEQNPDDLIFYFIDKFVERHERLTRLLVDHVMAEDAFALIRAASTEDVERASSWWVRLHEYHHRQGDMPIPEYLSVKSSKPVAGVEELRTDISSMLVCLNDTELDADGAALTYEYMLAERLLRYAVEGIPRPNYDAVASQVLFTYLREAGGIHLRGGRIHLDPDLPAVLAAFLADVHAIEAHIHTETPQQVKQRLMAFTRRYTDYDEENRDYRHIPFFAEVKERLGI